MADHGNGLSNSHFDGLLSDDERSPDGFKKVQGVGSVLVDPNTGRLVLTGKPNKFHHCDQIGCGSLEHKIAEFNIGKESLEPIRNHVEGDDE